MPTTFEKLNLKDQTEILVVGAPASFEPELASLSGVRVVRDVKAIKAIGFSLAFVTKQKEVDTLARAIGKKATGDALIWFAYPKGTSKNYKCEFNRDTGWAVLGELGFEGVRMVAIDLDWSALRFRKAEYIRTMIRGRTMAMSKAGKRRVASRKK